MRSNDVLALCVMVAAACSTSPNAPSGRGELGVFTPRAGAPSPTAADGGSVLVPRATVSANDDALTARIETPDGLTLEILTVACAGECADVVAEPRNGNPPYAIKWDDGSTTAERHVCPLQDGELSVTVTDTAITDTEFRYAASTAVARVTSEVLECAGDAGTDASATDTVVAECKQISINMSDADGCERLLPRQCESGPFEQAYDLPYALGLGNRSCMVVFGNVTSVLEPDTLNFIIATDQTPDSERCREAGSGEFLWDGSSEVPANSDPTMGRVLCLREPSVASRKLYINANGLMPNMSGLDFRLCARCPSDATSAP